MERGEEGEGGRTNKGGLKEKRRREPTDGEETEEGDYEEGRRGEREMQGKGE